MTRFFLGLAETAFFPGALFLLSKWYKRDELGTQAIFHSAIVRSSHRFHSVGQRISILYCGNIISNAFGSLFASGILDGMQGKLGQAAWR